MECFFLQISGKEVRKHFNKRKLKQLLKMNSPVPKLDYSQEVPAFSIELRCPNCGAKIQTKLEKVRSIKKTVLAGASLLLLG